MGTWLDDTSKKTMILIVTPTGKTKMAGFYQLTPLNGQTMLVTLPNLINGPCGIEFDDVAYLDDYSLSRDRQAGQLELSTLGYEV